MADIVRPATLEKLLKQQEAIPTGTVLDRMCLTENGEHALGGIPKGCTIAFCGPPGKGKSRTALAAMAEVAANGGKVAYVVAEEGFVDPEDSGRDDLCSRLAKICMTSQGIDEAGFREKIAPNLWVMLSQYHRGHAWSDFVNRYRYLVEKEGINFVVIDSLNTLDPSRNKTADNLATLKTYNHENGITCLTIGQIRDNRRPRRRRSADAHRRRGLPAGVLEPLLQGHGRALGRHVPRADPHDPDGEVDLHSDRRAFGACRSDPRATVSWCCTRITRWTLFLFPRWRASAPQESNLRQEHRPPCRHSRLAAGPDTCT